MSCRGVESCEVGREVDEAALERFMTRFDSKAKCIVDVRMEKLLSISLNRKAAAAGDSQASRSGQCSKSVHSLTPIRSRVTLLHGAESVC